MRSGGPSSGRCQRPARQAFQVGALDAVVDDVAEAARGGVGGGGAGDLGHAGRGGDARRDRRVGGRDDLGSGLPVDLVAVVPGRIVAGRDHHPRRRGELGDGEGAERSGHGIGEEMHGDAEAGEHGRGVLRELPAGIPPVEAHDHAAVARGQAGLAEKPGPQAVGGLDDHHPVHAREAGLHPSAQAGGPEVEGCGEPVRELLPGRRVPGLHPLEERLELRPRLGVGVLGEERAGGFDRRSHRRIMAPFSHWSSQPSTVSCHSLEFCGFSTQWFSSGKKRSFDGIPLPLEGGEGGEALGVHHAVVLRRRG